MLSPETLSRCVYFSAATATFRFVAVLQQIAWDALVKYQCT